jgi:hypothetical protein
MNYISEDLLLLLKDEILIECLLFHVISMATVKVRNMS